MKLVLSADKVRIRGPKVDGGYVVTLEMGEYMVKHIAKLMAELDNENVVDVTLEQKSEKSD